MKKNEESSSGPREMKVTSKPKAFQKLKLWGSSQQEWEKWQGLDELISFQIAVGKRNPQVAWINMPEVIK